MRIDVRFHGLDFSRALREHTEGLLHDRLDRFEHEISSVVVRFSDLNGPRGGIDKRCRVLVHGPRLGPIILDEDSADPHAAVDLAVDRVVRALGRQLHRMRRRSRASSVPPTAIWLNAS